MTEIPQGFIELLRREQTKIDTVTLVQELCRLTGWSLKVELGKEEEIHMIVPYQMVDLFGVAPSED
jgi:hypothetical protein